MSQLTRQQIENEYNQSGTGSFKDNTTRYITPAILRAYVKDIVDSLLNLLDHAYNGIKAAKPGISTIANLKSIVTVGMDTGVHITFRDTGSSNVLRVYELVSGTDAESSPNVIRPNDYAASTNEKVWKLASVGSSFGGSTGSTDNSILRSDGTGGVTLQGSSASIDDSANLVLGTASLAGNKQISAVNSTTDAALTIVAQGQVTVTPVGNFNVNSTNNINLNAGSTGKVIATVDSATTNAPISVEKLVATSTGTPANGIGVEKQFEVETSAGNNEIGAEIEVVATDVTSASEDFDFIFKLMAAGAAAAEAFRLKSDGSAEFAGPAKLKSYTVAGVPTASSYTGAMIYVSNESGGAVPAFSDGTNWRRVTDRAIIS